MNTRHRQRIVRERRQYNQWVNSQTLEDYALRYTPERARKSIFRVGNTALGPIAFLACEAIGGSLTLTYGFSNAVWAIVFFSVLMFLIGLPIARYAARYGVDIDLLTRGAGFGYMGSTITSLIYASFTFILFSIEASIMSVALHMLLGLPLAVAHIISSLIVIPIALYGISLISRMQIATQSIWLVLQFLPLIYVATRGRQDLADWTHYSGAQGNPDGSINLLLFGMAASTLLSLLPQVGEQVDYLRFLPECKTGNRRRWWAALLLTGPGWVLLGGFKLIAGSFLAWLAVRHGLSADAATQPTSMYSLAFRQTLGSPSLGLLLAGVFVIVCQLKINVTNAYAGSIAWSNFFSRLTHSHPGRVVWLVFNVLLALLLMETDILHVVEGILRIYANFAAGWIGALTADLVINKPLGYSPPYIEFKRAHLYDINPVGVGALFLSILISTLPFSAASVHPADPLALHRPCGRLRCCAAHRLGDERTLLPGPQAWWAAARANRDPLHDLRKQLREPRHGHVSGLFRPDLLTMLHSGGPLPRCVQGEQPVRSATGTGSAVAAAQQMGRRPSYRAPDSFSACCSASRWQTACCCP